MKEKYIVTKDELIKAGFTTDGQKFGNIEMWKSDKQLMLLTTQNEIYLLFDNKCNNTKSTTGKAGE